jgi:hypothetical protein
MEQEVGISMRRTATTKKVSKTQLYRNSYCILAISKGVQGLTPAIPEEPCSADGIFKNAQPIHIFYLTFVC